ncbi:hypothetical protein [Spiroplasma diminutum]|uniref:Uncharacterized protein n=1 Tax=Spiroplasma diminutum CUAS-1 TaxID=1276221 RepID=S5LWT8_9MOLU|nr:hypothetical protein [Spiroplasma diminutum]AGR42234.1 hypothetical protein SDIMI_v3c05300 [Spiroplasma diminutum CUAS-1]
MRIIPYELYKYSPDLCLTALRKEFGMYDYCLNVNPNNKAMQPFLDLKRNYFNMLIFKWVEEMTKRGHYINTFHSFYAENNSFEPIKTDFFLILECIIQWDLKDFYPYNTKLKWYEISLEYLKNSDYKDSDFSLEKYSHLLEWYKNNFMSLNNSNNLKPKNLDILKVIEYFKIFLL